MTTETSKVTLAHEERGYIVTITDTDVEIGCHDSWAHAYDSAVSNGYRITVVRGDLIELTWPGLTWPGPTCTELNWPGPTLPGPTWPEPTCRGQPVPGPTCTGPT